MALQNGIGLLQQGRLREAGEVFAAVIGAEPSNALAHHLAGIVQLQTGEVEAGVASLRRSIALKPDDAVAHGNLANALRDSGAVEEASDSYARALALDPNFVDAYANRALLLGALGRLDEALQDCERAVRLAPLNPMVHMGRGHVLLGLGRPQEALSSYDLVLQAAPDAAEIWSLRGEALAGVRRFEEAAASFRKALALGLGGPTLHLNLGNALWDLGRISEALAQYDRVLELDPVLGQAWANRGVSLRLLDRHAEALESLGKALALDPANAEHPFNRGVVLSDLGRYREAFADFDTALRLNPEFHRAKRSYAFARLATGDFDRGWPLYEARWQGEDGGWLALGAPHWRGETSLQGKTILLRGEQGLGDSLQFCRYAKHVKALGAQVILEVPAPLMRLMATLEGVDEIVEQGLEPPAADCQCLLMSLPLALRDVLAGIPAEVPYLSADPDAVAAWRARLGPRTRPRVGLVWSGGFRDEPSLRWTNARRNIALDRLASFKGLDVDFISLQKGEPGESELRTLKAQGWDGPEILEVMGGVGDFADTAALVQALDLVVAVDTSTAHLAGALGKPVWIMNRYDSCWRWLTDRDDSPWYPTVRLFRQDAVSDWDSVVTRVRAALESL